jgi:hypothetical protein
MIIRPRMSHLIALFVLTGTVGFADDVPPRIKDSDPAIRLEAWHTIAKDSQEVVKNADQLLPILPIGLRDSDGKVRSQIAKMAAVLGLASYKQRKFPLSSNPETVKALLDLLDDEDASIRKSAAQAVVWGVGPTKDLEESVVTKYSNEKLPKRRAELLSVIAMISGPKDAAYNEREPTEGVVKLIVNALDDSAKPIRAAAAEAMSFMKTPPAEALPKLVDALDPFDPEVCQYYVMTIQRYGASAAPYLHKLEELRTKLENSKTTNGSDALRANLDSAIHVIREESKKVESGESKK